MHKDLTPRLDLHAEYRLEEKPFPATLLPKHLLFLAINSRRRSNLFRKKLELARTCHTYNLPATLVKQIQIKWRHFSNINSI